MSIFIVSVLGVRGLGMRGGCQAAPILRIIKISSPRLTGKFCSAYTTWGRDQRVGVFEYDAQNV